MSLEHRCSGPSGAGDSFRCFDFVTGLYPSRGSAGYIQKIRETELLRNAGRGAGAITAGTDDGAGSIGIQPQSGKCFTELRQGSGYRARCMATLILGWPTHVYDLKI